MKFPVRVYLAGELVATGDDKDVVVAMAKIAYPDEQMVGEEDLTDERTVGFFINPPAGMGL